MTQLALIPGLPLLGFLINGLWYALIQTKPGADKHKATPSGLIATGFIFLAFLVSVANFLSLKAMPEDARVLQQTLFTWIEVSNLSLDFSLKFDALSSLFALVITGVGTLIHLYSIGYMSHDEAPTKFFAYLNLFCFAMLVLVLGASLPVLFLGWEGVGLCSYLLIGFWYKDNEKASAGKKAFIVNRIGDLGFLLATFMIFSIFGSLDFATIAEKIDAGTFVQAVSAETWTAIALLLFLGCTGKSAQIPLFVWLPDAMAGPTPVSALIHAATMVTSGIYLCARLSPLFMLSSTAMGVIATVGALTAFVAATIAVVQTDIKKVLAYSTVSQLGYMFLGVGVGAFSGGVFHVMTHAFFKALMFLGAGSVIHGMHEEQNILKMGGLKKSMPLTYITFLFGWLAICGVPFFSGFFSKDEILWNAFASPYGSKALWALGLLTALMTAFYMTRLFYLTFLGDKTRSSVHPHESPLTMTFPLMILAVLSVFGGALGIPAVMAEHAHWLDGWLHHTVFSIPHADFTASHATEVGLMVLSSLVALVGIALAFVTYRQPDVAEARKKKFLSLHNTLTNKWYFDEVYQALIVEPTKSFSVFLWKAIDVLFIDRIVLGFGKISMWGGQVARSLQTGSLQVYALFLVLGVCMALGVQIYAWIR